jgi:hypothetical protein
MYVLGIAACYCAMKAGTLDSWWMVACLGSTNLILGGILASLISKVTK